MNTNIDLSSYIIFEDDDIVLLNKPAGVVVNTAQTHQEATVQDWLNEYLPKNQTIQTDQIPSNFSPQYGTPQEIFESRQGFAHRLDKDTSGVLLIGKHPAALVNLLTQFKDRKPQKTYLALVHGKLNISQGEIAAPLARNPRQRLQYTVRPEGKPALTRYHLQKTFTRVQGQSLKLSGSDKKRMDRLYQGFSLVQFFPQTGRTHQIRVHAQFITHPIVADDIYGGKKRLKLDKIWCPRQFLHAAALAFDHPATGQRITIEADLPAELVTALEHLE